MSFTFFKKFPVLKYHRLYSLIGNGRNALAVTFNNHPPCLLNGEFCKQNLRRIFYQQPLIVSQPIAAPCHINILSYVTAIKFRKFTITQYRCYAKKVKRKKKPKKKKSGFLSKVKSMFGGKKKAKASPSKQAKTGTSATKSKICGHFKRDEPKKKKRTPVKVIKAIPDPVECSKKGKSKKKSTKSKEKKLDPKKQREVEEKAVVTCPNPPKADDPMGLPYYFKKVCVEKDSGVCKKFEMQRMPIKLQKKETDSGKKKKPRIIQARMPSKVRADICKPHIKPYRKKKKEPDICKTPEEPCPKEKVEEPICNRDPSEGKQKTQEPCKEKTQPPCPKIATEEPVCNLDPSKGKQKPCKETEAVGKDQKKEEVCKDQKKKEVGKEQKKKEEKKKVCREPPDPYKVKLDCSFALVQGKDDCKAMKSGKGKKKDQSSSDVSALPAPCDKVDVDACKIKEASGTKKDDCKATKSGKGEKKDQLPDVIALPAPCDKVKVDACKKKKESGKKEDLGKNEKDSGKKKEDTCKKKADPSKKKEDPCEKTDPCKVEEDSCKKIEDPCKKEKDPCKKKEDSCKERKDPCKKKEDPCKKKDPCKVEEDSCKKEEDPCNERKDPCKKKEDPCKKKDPCKVDDDPCKKKDDACRMKDPCKSKSDPCLKKKDTCKEKEDPCKKKKDPRSKRDPCKAESDPCKIMSDPCLKKKDTCIRKEDSGKKEKDLCKTKSDSSLKKVDHCKTEVSCKKKSDPSLKKKAASKSRSENSLKKEDPCKSDQDSSKKKDPCKSKSKLSLKQDDPCKKKKDPSETKPKHAFTKRELEDRARLKPRHCTKFAFKAPEEYEMKESKTVKKQAKEECKETATKAKPKEQEVCTTTKPKENECFEEEEKEVKKKKEKTPFKSEEKVKKAKVVRAKGKKKAATKKAKSCKVPVLCKLKKKFLKLLGRKKKVQIKVKAVSPVKKPPKKGGKGGKGGSGSGSSGKKGKKASGKNASKPKVTLQCKSKGKAVGVSKNVKVKCVQKKVVCDEKKCKIERVCSEKTRIKKRQKVVGSKCRVNNIKSNIYGLQKTTSDIKTKLTFVCRPKTAFCKQICVDEMTNKSRKREVETTQQKEKSCKSKKKPKIVCGAKAKKPYKSKSKAKREDVKSQKLKAKKVCKPKKGEDDEGCTKLGVKKKKAKQPTLCTKKPKCVSKSKRQKPAPESEGTCSPKVRSKVRESKCDAPNFASAEELEEARTKLCSQKPPKQQQVKAQKVVAKNSSKRNKSRCNVLESIWGTITSDKRPKMKTAKGTHKTAKCKSKAKAIKIKPEIVKMDVCMEALQKEIDRRVGKKCATKPKSNKKYEDPCMIALEKEIESRMSKKWKNKAKAAKTGKKPCKMGVGKKVKPAVRKTKKVTGRVGAPKKRRRASASAKVMEPAAERGFFRSLISFFFGGKPTRPVKHSHVKVVVKTKKTNAQFSKSPKKTKPKVCTKPEPKKTKKTRAKVCSKPEPKKTKVQSEDDSCEGIERLGFKSKATKQHCKKIRLKVKKPKRQKKRSQFKVNVCKGNDEQSVFCRRPRKCPKFPFIPPSEAEAKSKPKAKKGKIVCLKMTKKNMQSQSCHISTKAQGNGKQRQRLTQKCKRYAVSGLHRITLRLPSHQSRLFSKNRDECKDPQRDKPCDQNTGKSKNPICKQNRKIICYCLRKSGKGEKGPCEKRCDDEVPDCRHCKRYEVQEDPIPKRKKEKFVRPKKLQKKPPPPPAPKISKCKAKEKRQICGGDKCPKPKADLEYGPPRIEPIKPKKKEPTGICGDADGDL